MKFIIADDHPLYLSAVTTALKNWFSNIEIFEADSLSTLEKITQSIMEPDLIMLDLLMPGINGFSGLIHMRGCYPNTPIIILSGIDLADTVIQCKSFGADAYIYKSEKLPKIINIIEAVLKGGKVFPDIDHSVEIDNDNFDIAERIKSLSPKQFHTLCLLNNGMVNKQIASELNISVATVKVHISAILSKLGVKSRTQAALLAKRFDINTGISNC